MASRSAMLALLLIAGTAAPASQSTPTDGGRRVIEVVVRRFAFEPAEIEVFVGERVTLAVRSADGVHGLEIPRLRVNRTIPRGGETVRIDLVADAEGRYPVLCSEYCGNGHDDMKGVLVVRAHDADRP